MTITRVTLGSHDITVSIGHDEGAPTHLVLPVGVHRLRERELFADPPRPEELTNAIGAVFDHFDDVVRLAPGIVGAIVEMSGAEATAIVAVEVGATATLPFHLSRDAAEEVFRTLATEPASDRAANPGLDAAMVDTIVAGCCAMVAVMRRLQLDEVVVVP
jgi:exopolyphosphatase/guanosine-5'-triphosphate,3'-diphosphate pyrophosphatase